MEPGLNGRLALNSGKEDDDDIADSSCPSLPSTEDDTIRIKCPDLKDGTGRQFEMSRSVLSQSPTFAAFFQSPDYLHGSRTLLTLMSDPAACFDIIQQYLTEGPEKYTKTRFRVFVTIRYKIVDRLLVLIRLHALAHKLTLPALECMAFDSIVELDRYIKPEYCIILASLVFTAKAGFQPSIKSWCLGRIAKSFHLLRDNQEWRDLLWLLDVELFMQWEHWTGLNPSISPSPKSSADGRTVEEVIIGIPAAELFGHGGKNSLQETTTVRPTLDTSSTLKLIEEEGAMAADDDDNDEWSDAAEPPPPIPRYPKARTCDSPESAKAKSMLGIEEGSDSRKSSTEDETEILLMMEWRRVFHAPSYDCSSMVNGNNAPPAGIDTAKAREVMGLSPSSPSSPSSLPSPNGGSRSLTPQRRASNRGIVSRFFPTTPSKLGK